MTKEQLVELLTERRNSNLEFATRLCLEKINASTRCEITEGDYTLSAKHFHDVYAVRMKNPNGIALGTPGLPESVDNFAKLTEHVKMISVDLDNDSVTVWLSENSIIEGCMIHLGMMVTPEDRKPNYLSSARSKGDSKLGQD